MKGVYVIHDTETGEPYVGSAYGDTGIWQRWSNYALTLHGGNVGLHAHLAVTGGVLPQEHAVRSLGVLVDANR